MVGQGKRIHEEHCRGVQQAGRNLAAEIARLHSCRRARFDRCVQAAWPKSIVDGRPEGCALESAVRLRSRRAFRIPDPVTNDVWVFTEVPLAHQSGRNGVSVVAALVKNRGVKRKKEKSLVLAVVNVRNSDRATQCPTKVVELHQAFAEAALYVKRVGGVGRAVTKVFVNISVEIVRPRLQNDVKNPTPGV